MFGFRVLRKRWVLFLILFSSIIYFLVATFSKTNDLILEEYESRRTLRQPFQWQPKISDEIEVNDTVKIKCRNSVQGRKYIVDEREDTNYAFIQYYFPEENTTLSPRKRNGKPFVLTAPSVKKKIKVAVQSTAGPRSIASDLSGNLEEHTVPGYCCHRRHLDSNRCCDNKESSAVRYNCESCHNNGCCIVYEHCVSCCLQPDKQPLLSKILRESRDAKNEPYNKLFELVEDHFELCLAKCRTSSQSVQHENSYRDPRAKHCYGETPPDLQSVTV